MENRRRGYTNSGRGHSRPARKFTDVQPAKKPEAEKSAKDGGVKIEISLPELSPRAHKAILAVTGSILIIAALVGLFILARPHISFLKPSGPIPKDIAEQVNFVVFYPEDETGLQIDRESFKYDSRNPLLSYVGKTPDGTKVTISQQPDPENFKDIKSSYGALLIRLQVYKSFESPNGKVSLVKPKEFNGDQVATIDNKGTLLFARPANPLSDDTWRHVFQNLEAIQPEPKKQND